MGEIIIDRPGSAGYGLDEVRNKVIQGEAVSVLRRLPAESADLVFIDPPYYLQLEKKSLRRWNQDSAVNGVYEAWDRFDSFEAYDGFMAELLTAARRVMKPTGTVWVESTYHSLFRIGRLMQDLGFWLLNDVIWVKSNPMPNWLGVRFTNATETLIWAARERGARHYRFNKDWARVFGIGKVGANVWVFQTCKGGERRNGADGRRLHSAQKPMELLRRVILTSTEMGDVVLDPVAGTGTTGCVARALGRQFIMIEINPQYVAGIGRRLREPVIFKPLTATARGIIESIDNES